MPTDDQIRTFFAIVDSRQPDSIAEWFAPDIRLQMGAGEVLDGREAVHQAFRATAETFAAVRHDIRGIWRGEDDGAEVASVEALVTYTLGDGRSISIPCNSTLRFRGQTIADYRIFIDLTPLAARRP